MTIAEALQHEQPQLMPMPTATSSCRYGCRAPVWSAWHATVTRSRVPLPVTGSACGCMERLVVVADQAVIAEHARMLDRDRVVYDWQHYLPLVECKPGALLADTATTGREWRRNSALRHRRLRAPLADVAPQRLRALNRLACAHTWRCTDISFCKCTHDAVQMSKPQLAHRTSRLARTGARGEQARPLHEIRTRG
jgi:hypothetical protein